MVAAENAFQPAIYFFSDGGHLREVSGDRGHIQQVDHFPSFSKVGAGIRQVPDRLGGLTHVTKARTTASDQRPAGRLETFSHQLFSSLLQPPFSGVLNNLPGGTLTSSC